MSFKYQKLSSSLSTASTAFDGSLSEAPSNDKTQNFILKAQQNASSVKRTANPEIYSQDSFFKRSSHLRLMISTTQERINELNQLQKSSGLFNNEENKINELMFLVGDNISQIQSGIQALELSNPDMCIRQSRAGHQTYKVIIEIMQSQLMKITEIFKKTTSKRLEDMSQQQSKQQISFTSQVERRAPRNQGAQFLINNNFNNDNNQSQDIEGGSKEGQGGYRGMSYKDREQSQISESMKNINNQLQSVFEMFKKIGSMVQFHETIIERIDKNTDQAAVNLDKGKQHLISAHRAASSSRGLMIKIILIIMIFAFVYIVLLL